MTPDTTGHAGGEDEEFRRGENDSRNSLHSPLLGYRHIVVGKPQLVSGLLDNLPAQTLGNRALSFKDLTRKEREPIYLFTDRMLGCYFDLVFKWLQMSRSPLVPVPRLS